MAVVPSPEQCARSILAVFKKGNARSGAILRPKNFMLAWHEQGLKSADFDQGVKFAVENNWLTALPDHSWRLEPEGFAAM